MESEPQKPPLGIDRWVIAVGAAAVLVRLTYAGQGTLDPTFYHPVIDALTYHTLAQAIASGIDAWGGVFSRPPLYPYLLGGIYALVGPSMAVARMVQALLAGGTCVLTCLLGQRFFSRRVALAGGAIVAAYGPMVFFDQRLLASGLVVFCFTLALYAATLAAMQPTWHRWLACGLATGLAALARPNIAVFFAFALAWIVVTAARKRQWGPLIGRAACLLGGSAAVIAPVTVRNFMVSGDFVPIAALGGMNLYLGNNLVAEQTLAARPGPEWERLSLMPHAQGSVSIKASEDFYLALVGDYVRRHPGHFLRGLARKARLFCSSIEVPRNFDPYLHARFSNLLQLLMWRVGPFGFPFGLLGPLAVVGMAISCRRCSGRWLLAGYVTTCALSVILFFNASRYRLPIVPVLALFAAWMVGWFYRRLASRHYSALAGGVGATLGMGLLVSLPVATPYDRINFEADLYDNLGCQLILEQDLPAAERALRKALELAPDSAELYVSLSLALGQLDRHAEALRSARAAVKLAPEMPEARVALGQALFEVRDLRGATAAFRRALEIEPAHAPAHASLGVVLANQQRFAAAADAVRSAIHYNVREWRYPVSLARVLTAQRDYSEAIKTLRPVADRSDAPDAADALAWLLATCPDGAFRDPDAALALTDRTLRGQGAQNPTYLDTRAAAQAAAGRFDEAVKTAARASQLALNAGQYGQADAIDARRQQYTNRQPVREPLR